MTRCNMPYPFASSTHCCLPVGHDGPHVTRDGGGWNDSPDYADGGVAAALAGEEADRAADSNQYCPAERGEYACSREDGHDGPHVAATCDVQNSICAVWDDTEDRAERGALLHRALDAEKERDEAVERAEKHRRAEADHRNNARCWMKTSEEWQATAEKWEKRAVRAEQERDQARREQCMDPDVHWRYDDAVQDRAEAVTRAVKAERSRDVAIARAERAECHDCIRDAAVIREPRALTAREHLDAADLSDVTRIVVIGPGGSCSEKWGVYSHGARLDIQDEGLTLKVFPADPPAPSRPEWADLADRIDDAMAVPGGIDGDSLARILHEGGVRVATEER